MCLNRSACHWCTWSSPKKLYHQNVPTKTAGSNATSQSITYLFQNNKVSESYNFILLLPAYHLRLHSLMQKKRKKVKPFVSPSSLLVKTHCFHNTFWLSRFNTCFWTHLFFVDSVWSVVYEHSSIVNSQLSVWMEAYGGTGNPKSFYIWLSNTLCEFSLGGLPSC